jgi:hypothetical protein
MGLGTAPTLRLRFSGVPGETPDFIVNKMAKATLTYDLNDPDDRLEHLRAVKATDMALVIFELVYNTRKRIQYDIDKHNLNGDAVLDRMMIEISERLDEHGIIIDDLVR